MSDSDDNFVPNNFHNFPYEKSGLHGTYGNMTTSKFNQPNQFVGFQRSMYSIRETSPMSLQSFPNSRIQSQQSYPRGPMSSQGSVYNGRCRSPMSVRSIDSTATVSAADIALAFRTTKFSKRDFRIIQEAYNVWQSKLKRRRIAKKRNLKSFVAKYCSRTSGGESGAEGSNSSVSSDDCRSTRSAFYTTHNPRVPNRPPKNNFNKITTQMKENDIYNDCTESFKHNSFKSLLPANNRTVNEGFMPHHNQLNKPKNYMYSDIPGTSNVQCNTQNQPSVTNQPFFKERFAEKTSTLLPFQRFNQSSVKPTYETFCKPQSGTLQHKALASNTRYEESDDDSEEIFPQNTSRLNMTQSHTFQKNKRVYEDDNNPERKRKKLSTSPDNQNKVPGNRPMIKNSDFNFKRPQLPVRRIGPVTKRNEPEILISKSAQPLIGNLDPVPIQLKEKPNTVDGEDKEDSIQVHKSVTQNHVDSTNSNAETTHNSTNISNKSSFIKRKLFTQKLDIAENKNNISSDDLNSPQTKVSKISKEKNKVRKFTSQSCLSRDVHSDSNYLDLIHKIVPPEQIKKQNLNATKGKNKEANKNIQDKESKWDVTLALSTTLNDNKSDTYTDDEIFNVPQRKKNKTPNMKETDKGPKTDAPLEKKSQVESKCKVVLQKLPETFKDNNIEPTEECTTKRTLNFIKSFWDTDFESDMDDVTTLSSRRTFQADQRTRAPQCANSDSNIFKQSTLLSASSSQTQNQIKNNSDTNRTHKNLYEHNSNNIVQKSSSRSHSKTKEPPQLVNKNSNLFKSSNTIKSARSPEKLTENQCMRSCPMKNLSVQSKADKENNVNVMPKSSSRSRSKTKEAPQLLNKSSSTISSSTNPENLNVNKSIRSCRMRSLGARSKTLSNLYADKENNTNIIPSRSSRSRSKTKEVSQSLNRSSSTVLSATSPEKLPVNQSMRSCRLKNLSVQKLHADIENSNANIIPKRNSRSRSKTNEAAVGNNKTNPNIHKKRSDSKSKPRNKKNNEPEKPEENLASKNNKRQHQSIFNKSRESLRLKEKRQSGNLSIDNNENNQSVNKSGNTSRESKRLKEKREANLKCR